MDYIKLWGFFKCYYYHIFLFFLLEHKLMAMTTAVAMLMAFGGLKRRDGTHFKTRDSGSMNN